ncbi:MAG TPA: GFA family protein [Gammaproteobacteria bacterium]
MKQLKGSCLCGAVHIEVPDEFAFIGNCHCSACRKWTGSAFASGGSVKSGDLAITKGEDAVTRYRKSESLELAFCAQCGSSLFSWKPELGFYVIRLGILDDAPSQKPALHIFVGSKAPWHEITDALPAYKSAP